MTRKLLVVVLFCLVVFVRGRRLKKSKSKSSDDDWMELFAFGRLRTPSCLLLDDYDAYKLLQRLAKEFKDAAKPCYTKVEASVYEQIILFEDARVTILFVIQAEDECDPFSTPNLLQDIQSELIRYYGDSVSLESIQQVVPVPCPNNITAFDSEVLVELTTTVERITTVTANDAMVLQDGFVSVYNTLQDGLCDPLFRRLQSVVAQVVPQQQQQQQRRLQPALQFFFISYVTRGTCRGCLQDSNILDDGFRRLSKNNDEIVFPEERCFCPLDLSFNILRPPNEEEVLFSYSGFVQEEAAQGNLEEVTGVGDTIIQVDETRPSSTPTTSPSFAHPTTTPSTSPTTIPSTSPTTTPTFTPSTKPTTTPSLAPTTTPSLAPSITRSGMPSPTPSNTPSVVPSLVPTAVPTMVPSRVPSITPSTRPSREPSVVPSLAPSSTPSSWPTGLPSAYPTVVPSGEPSDLPSLAPSVSPSENPSDNPSANPSLSSEPTESPKPSPAPTTSVPPLPTGSPAPSPSPSIFPTL